MADLVEFVFTVGGTIHDKDTGFWDPDEEEGYSWTESLKLAKGGNQQTVNRSFIVDNEVELKVDLTFLVFSNGEVMTTAKWAFFEGDSGGKEFKLDGRVEPLSVDPGVKSRLVQQGPIYDDEGDWFTINIDVANMPPPPPDSSGVKPKSVMSFNVPEKSAKLLMNLRGAIYQKWVAIGRENSFLGLPVVSETLCPDGKGYFVHFQGGSIYWTATTGSHEIHGAIRDKWASLGWERGFLGYPLTEESTTPDGIGRYNHFQGGSVYWTPHTGAQEVHGAIRDKWASLGWETGRLGYPISGEFTDADGRTRISNFQNGHISWTPEGGAVVHYPLRITDAHSRTISIGIGAVRTP